MSEDNKPCRSCTDFQTWAKIQKKTYDSEKGEKQNIEDKPEKPLERVAAARTDCPLDKNELGSKTWAFLHTMAAYYPDNPSRSQQKDMNTFFRTFSQFYPCSPCAEHLREQLKKSPPRTSSQSQLSEWLCKIHNIVNERVGKPEFNCKLVNQRWRDGWLDGSCDE